MRSIQHPQIQPFLDYLRFEKRYSPYTLRSYHDDLVQFFDYLHVNYGDGQVSETYSQYIRSWLASLKEEKLSPRSINRKISSLKSYYKFEVRAGRLGSSPMSVVITPRVSKRLPEFIRQEDLPGLLKVSGGTDSWKGWNARLILILFYATGVRLSELINLREQQVDFFKKTIKVLGKGNKERIIPVSPEILDLINQYIQGKREYFPEAQEWLLVTERGKKIYSKYAYLLVKEQLGQVKTLQKKSPHILRHSFATHLANNGADLSAVKELLGHTSLAATQVYTHNTIEKLKSAYQKAHPKA